MTREDIDNIRSNSALMTKISEKISQLERVIKDRGETFTRIKEMSNLRAEYKLLDTAETRKRLLAVGTKVYRTDQIGAVQVSGENVEAYVKK